MRDLIEKVKQWGLDRNIVFTGAESQDKQKMMEAQARYTLKETAEILDAYADQDIDKMRDAVGDTLVTIIVGSSSDYDIFVSFSNYLCQHRTYQVNNDFYSHYIDLIDLIDRLFRDIRDGYLTHYNYLEIAKILELIAISDYCQSSFKDCLELAYNEIKNRTGKVVNGQFIKDK